MPVSLRRALRRLARRVAVGHVLELWPPWAAASLFVAGTVALVCRLFVPAAASGLRWLWLAPLVAAVPPLVACLRRAYRPSHIVALADSLSGGHGLLLTLWERKDSGWLRSPLADQSLRFALPRLRPWRKLAPLAPAAIFLAVAMAVPQRPPRQSAQVLPDEIVADVTAAVEALRQQELITTEEEQRLEDAIERIRRAAQERVDASSWEAADALREQLAARAAEKHDAITWAEEALARYAAANRDGATSESYANALAAELTQALERLAQAGLLAGAPADLQQMLKAGRLRADLASLQDLVESLSRYLAETEARFGSLASLGKEFGRFDPSEFPLAQGSGRDGDGMPGRGGINRGRADAPLTWGEETVPLDRFKAHALPPGAARSPDDWAPIVEVPGAPRESAARSAPSAARHYAAAAGQTAWRRTLAPRHQSAVKKYFEK